MFARTGTFWFVLSAWAGVLATSCDGGGQLAGSDGGDARRRVDGDAGVASDGGRSSDGATDRDGPVSPDLMPGVVPGGLKGCDLRISEVAVYQAVKVSLGTPDRLSALRNADLVQNRAALLRVFVAAGLGGLGRDTVVRLRLQTGDRVQMQEAQRMMGGDSADATLDSTFNFDLAPSDLGADTTISAELVTPSACLGQAGTRFPRQGTAPLDARRTGTLRVRVVPLLYGGDGSSRPADPTAADLVRFKATLLALYPIEDLELSVRAPATTRIDLAMEDGWPFLLDSLRDLRAQDGAPDDLYYYGLVRPGIDLRSYCGQGCVLGIGYQAPVTMAGLRVAVGIGFPGPMSADTMAHELGHSHGRGHAPCGGPSGIDTGYPYRQGAIGSWGFDPRSRQLLPPTETRDMMGYCNPRFISDYTYQGILQRSVLVNGDTGFLRAAEAPPQPALAVLVDGRGRARWGHPLLVPPAAAEPQEEAQVFDRDGRLVARVSVTRVVTGDGGDSLLILPTARPGWHAVRTADMAAPLAFDDKSPVPSLESAP